MVIELGLDGFISLQAKLVPERLILVVASGDLVQAGEGQEPLLPSGMFHYEDQMRGHVPSFCLHPFDPAPAKDDQGDTAWTWFSNTVSGFWTLDLIHDGSDGTWGCGVALHEGTAETDSSEATEVFSLWIPLPGYDPDHDTPGETVPFRKHHMVN